MAAAKPATADPPERIVLIGTPSQLSGLVRMSNPGSEKLKIKTAPLRLKDRPDAALQLTLGMRIPPGATAHAPVSLQLDPRTPPGELRGEVQVGDDAREVIIKVLEHREVSIVPQDFRIHAAPGAKVAVPALVTNLGNVPFTLPRAALVALAQAQGFEQLFHVAMARAGSKGHEAALDAFAQLLAASEVAAPKVAFGAGAGKPLAPGASVETTLTFELPADLARHRLYVGSFLLGRTPCTVEIEVDTPGAETTATTKPPRRTRGEG